MHFFLYRLSKLPVKILLVLLLISLSFDLVIIEGPHLHFVTVHFGLSLRGFHMILYDILEGQHVPSTILPWLHLTRDSLLHYGLELRRWPLSQRPSSPTVAVVLYLLVSDRRDYRFLEDLWGMLYRPKRDRAVLSAVILPFESLSWWTTFRDYFRTNLHWSIIASLANARVLVLSSG